MHISGKISRVAGAGIILLALVAADDAPDYRTRELVVEGREPVTMTINGQPVRLEVAPESLSIPTLNHALAARLGLEPSLINFAYRLGPARLLFNTDVARFAMEPGEFRRRSAFSAQDVTPGADGEIGPGGLPYGRVTYQLGPPQAGESDIVLPMEQLGRSQVGVAVRLPGDPDSESRREREGGVVHVAFSLSRRDALTSASGGVALVDALGGHFAGDSRDVPVRFGVMRPARPLVLGAPLMLGPLEVRNIVVRHRDNGTTLPIAEGEDQGDPNEIVVTARDGQDRSGYAMAVGLDTFGHCSRLRYDFVAETVTLTCPPQPGA